MSFVVPTTCPFCGSKKDVVVDPIQYNMWRHHGFAIQNAMPQLSASDRERLVTGACDDCWDEMERAGKDQEDCSCDQDDEPAGPIHGIFCDRFHRTGPREAVDADQ